MNDIHLIITVNSGLVGVKDLPLGVSFEVRDYDIDGVHEGDLTLDEDGDFYIEQ